MAIMGMASLSSQIEHLSTHHAAHTGSSRQTAHQLQPHPWIGMHLRAGDHIEGQRKQSITRQNGSGLVKGLVHSRLAAPQIIIIHHRQIIMDQRIAMDTFQSRRSNQCPIRHRPATGLMG